VTSSNPNYKFIAIRKIIGENSTDIVQVKKVNLGEKYLLSEFDFHLLRIINTTKGQCSEIEIDISGKSTEISYNKYENIIDASKRIQGASLSVNVPLAQNGELQFEENFNDLKIQLENSLDDSDKYEVTITDIYKDSEGDIVINYEGGEGVHEIKVTTVTDSLSYEYIKFQTIKFQVL
jgi:hypothetical protein